MNCLSDIALCKRLTSNLVPFLSFNFFRKARGIVIWPLVLTRRSFKLLLFGLDLNSYFYLDSL